MDKISRNDLNSKEKKSEYIDIEYRCQTQYNYG